MAFHKYKIKERSEQLQYLENEKVITTIVHSNANGYLDAGETVTVIAVLESSKGRSYDIRDKYGNLFYNVKTI